MLTRLPIAFATTIAALLAAVIPLSAIAGINGQALLREDIDGRTMQAVYVAYARWEKQHRFSVLTELGGKQLTVSRSEGALTVSIDPPDGANGPRDAATKSVVTGIPTTELPSYASLPGYSIPGEHIAAFIAVQRYRDAHGVAQRSQVHLGSPRSVVHLVTNVDHLLLVAINDNPPKGIPSTTLGCPRSEYYVVDAATFSVTPFDGCVESPTHGVLKP